MLKDFFLYFVTKLHKMSMYADYIDLYSNIIIHTTKLASKIATDGRYRAIFKQHLRKTTWFSAQPWSFLKKWQHCHSTSQTIIKIVKYANSLSS